MKAISTRTFRTHQELPHDAHYGWSQKEVSSADRHCSVLFSLVVRVAFEVSVALMASFLSLTAISALRMPASSEHPIYEGRKLRERVFCQGECGKDSRIREETERTAACFRQAYGGQAR